MLQVDLPVASPPGPLRGRGLGARSPCAMPARGPGTTTLSHPHKLPENVGIRVAGWCQIELLQLATDAPTHHASDSPRFMLQLCLSSTPIRGTAARFIRATLIMKPRRPCHRRISRGDQKRWLDAPHARRRKFFIVWDTEPMHRRHRPSTGCTSGVAASSRCLSARRQAIHCIDANAALRSLTASRSGRT